MFICITLKIANDFLNWFFFGKSSYLTLCVKNSYPLIIYRKNFPIQAYIIFTLFNNGKTYYVFRNLRDNTSKIDKKKNFYFRIASEQRKSGTLSVRLTNNQRNFFLYTLSPLFIRCNMGTEKLLSDFLLPPRSRFLVQFPLEKLKSFFISEAFFSPSSQSNALKIHFSSF